MALQRVTRSTVIDAPIERVWSVLRDFNSHVDWHPVVAESFIEDALAPDQVGCVRNFRLADGAELREQLLALSDRDYVSTYCILDSTIPLERYVATVRLQAGDRRQSHVLALAVDVRHATGPGTRTGRAGRPHCVRGGIRRPAQVPGRKPAEGHGHAARVVRLIPAAMRSAAASLAS